MADCIKSQEPLRRNAGQRRTFGERYQLSSDGFETKQEAAGRRPRGSMLRVLMPSGFRPEEVPGGGGTFSNFE
jgi:hypothetical protein